MNKKTDNPTTFFVINNKYLCIMYLIRYGTIFVKQNYITHVSFINEQRRKLPLTTSRIANHNEEGGATMVP